MLITIQNIEEECGQLEDQCEQLKHRINRMLKEEDQDKLDGAEKHLEEIDVYFQENQKKAQELKTKLFTFSSEN